TDTAALAALAKAVKAAEAMAPTRPHPGVESATANLAAGPVAALIDRTRDAIRKATSSG
ncbi:hemerythrin domain-containing protein, partial [Streptomyces tauricus]